MRRIFVTGSTGYLGGYTCVRLLRGGADRRLALMIRARNRRDALEKLWAQWQLHVGVAEFRDLAARVEFVPGDLHAPGLGIPEEIRRSLWDKTDSVLHIAASLNRKSERACVHTNLIGGLSVLRLAREMADRGGLRRYSFVSTVAVAGERRREVVTEDGAIQWERRQYDPYARTKAVGEQMVAEILPDVDTRVFRPATVLGDSRFPDTTQWDMVRAFAFFAEIPALPWAPDVRQDIVNADYVGDAMAHIHMLERPKWKIYHLSSGTGSKTSADIVRALVSRTGRRPPRFVGALQRPFEEVVSQVERRGPADARRTAALLRVFLPYVTNDAVFDNGRVIAELGRPPVPFTEYAPALYEYAKRMNFRYPAQGWTGDLEGPQAG